MPLAPRLNLITDNAWRWLIILAVTFLLMFSLMTSSASADCDPAHYSGCSDTQNCVKPSFFGLETWYNYLPYQYSAATKRCEVGFNNKYTDSANNKTAILNDGGNSPILLIVLAVVDDLLRVAGIVAVVFVVIGGFKFITSSGEPEQIASAKNTITYAIIGLVVALIAVVIVSFIGSKLGV